MVISCFQLFKNTLTQKFQVLKPHPKNRRGLARLLLAEQSAKTGSLDHFAAKNIYKDDLTELTCLPKLVQFWLSKLEPPAKPVPPRGPILVKCICCHKVALLFMYMHGCMDLPIIHI